MSKSKTMLLWLAAYLKWNASSEVPVKYYDSAIFIQVSLLIKQQLTERTKDFHMILDDVAITDLSFSREYTHAVEAKQVG